ncbi:MAG: gliding motility-associated C-terminal domain-containing protein [Saprospiraceae bacterium]|nr:gliding motility-associated C-terminal domain-containing protein [Saprospiraceae bacterium]
MRKIFITLITGLFLLMGKSNAQLTLTMSNVVDVVPPTQATVDVTVSGFTNLLGVQYSINFDSLVLKYSSSINFTNALPGLSASAVSGPNGVGVKNGQITFVWFDQQGTGKSLPNGTRLFSIVFDPIGAKCTKSDVLTSNVPRIIEVVDNNFINVNLVNVKGNVSIKCDGGPVDPCPNPVCANPNSLMLIAPTIMAKPNDVICIPITVKNFKIMQSGQGTFTWDPTLLMFTEFKVPATGGIPMFDGGINSNNAATGQLGFLWSNNTPATPLTLPDNTKIIELCFKVIGPVDKTACLIIGKGTIPSEWTDNIGEVPVCFTYGRVNIITAPPADQVVIKAGIGNGAEDSVVCIDITVDNFINVLGASTKFTWNSEELEFVRTDMYNLEGLNSSGFSNGFPGFLNFLWISPNAITKPNGTKIFQICFKLLCKGTTDYTAIVSVPGPTEIVGQGSVILPSSTMSGSIAVDCGEPPPPPPTCTLGASTNITCFGENNGSILLSVTGITDGCTCVWKNAAGTIVKASGPVSAGCNLTGVPAGTYSYEVTCDNKVVCSNTANPVTITQPTAINIPTANVVTNIGCGQKGSINLSTTSGGTPPYTFSWVPNLGNTSNPTNLDAGQYSVTVTDANTCTATVAPFTIGSTQTDLAITLSSTNVKCKDGNDGSILLSIVGGCTPYSIVWSGGLSGTNPLNIKAGTYSVTVTDISNPAQTKTGTVTITEPATSVGVTSSNIIGSMAALSVGSITLNISGGTPNYTTSWSGPTNIPAGTSSGTLTANSLAPGTYNVTVTDANKCTAVLNGIVVPVIPPVVDTIVPKIGISEVTSNFNGFGVACFGDKTGAIKITLSDGTYPITATLKLGTQSLQSIVVNGPDIIFSNLGSGTYTVEVKNPKGTVISNDLVITQPTKLAASTPKIACTNKSEATGSIEINLNNSGTAPYTYEWFGLSDEDNKIENLGKDVYNVTVTDDNGCQLKISNIEVKECPITGGPCYTATTIITPNGDNFNDVFVINCVDDGTSDLTVFDRWGRVVYSQNSYDNTWLGIDNSGKDLKESAYMWVLTVNFGQGKKEIYKGTVTVLRNK